LYIEVLIGFGLVFDKIEMLQLILQEQLMVLHYWLWPYTLIPYTLMLEDVLFCWFILCAP